MNTARWEHEWSVGQLRLKRAGHSAPPSETIADLIPEYECSLYRERIEWDRTYAFLYRDGRLVVVLDERERAHLFHTIMIKLYTRPRPPIQKILNPADVPVKPLVNLIQTVSDERDPCFKKCRQKVYDGINSKGDVRPIPKCSLPKDVNFIVNRLVLTINEHSTEKPIYEVRWILSGH